MFDRRGTVIGIAVFLPLVALSQSAPDFSKLRINVIAEQKDFTLHFKEGAIGSLGGGSDFNSFTGNSTDMGGGLLRTIIFLDQIVPEGKAATMASFQGHLEGTVRCKRVRRGDSPDLSGSEDPHSPAGRVHVLAEGCSIVSINH